MQVVSNSLMAGLGDADPKTVAAAANWTGSKRRFILPLVQMVTALGLLRWSHISAEVCSAPMRYAGAGPGLEIPRRRERSGPSGSTSVAREFSMIFNLARPRLGSSKMQLKLQELACCGLVSP